jgi:hypothetical protein
MRIDGVPMNNVIEFPAREVVEGELTRLPTTTEEARSNVEGVRHIYINDITEVAMSTLVQQCMGAGFDVLNDEYKKDFGFLIEAIRSSLCRTIGIYHPFQDVSDNILTELDDESGTLKIADSISVKFQNDENDAEDEPEAEVSP